MLYTMLCVTRTEAPSDIHTLAHACHLHTYMCMHTRSCTGTYTHTHIHTHTHIP